MVAEHVVTRLDLVDLRTADDGAEPVPCPDGGERYRRLSFGTMDLSDYVELDDVTDLTDGRLDQADSYLDAALTAPEVAVYLNRSRSVFTDDPVPRQVLYFGDEGESRGAWLTADLVPFEDGSVLVRLEASTVCG